MTREELLIQFQNLTTDMNSIMEKKNNDYSPEADALENFSDFGWKGIVVRIGDKYNRLKTFVKSNKPVNNESIEDTLMDNAIYSLLALIKKREEDNK